jgi:hypothetical protein
VEMGDTKSSSSEQEGAAAGGGGLDDGVTGGRNGGCRAGTHREWVVCTLRLSRWHRQRTLWLHVILEYDCWYHVTPAGKTPTPAPDRTPEPGDDKPQPSGAETGVTGNNDERGEEVGQCKQS